MTRKLIDKCKQPPEGSSPLHFDSKYSCGWTTQLSLLLHRNALEYWRMPEYNTMRILFTCMFGFTLGSIYWRIGTERYDHAYIKAGSGQRVVHAGQTRDFTHGELRQG